MNVWFLPQPPLLPPLILAGIFNVIVAYQKLNRDCQSPLFMPWRTRGFYVWISVQLTLPALVAFFFCGITDQTKPDFTLYWKAISVGFFFTLFVNANADLGFINFSVDKFYAFFNGLAYKAIAADQTGKLTEFQADLEQELNTMGQGQLKPILNYLKRYFTNDFGLQRYPTEQTKLIQEVDRALALTQKQAQTEAVIDLIMKVRRPDCRQLLKRFGCRQPFLTTYFK